jgi:hypothetical protein
MKMETACSSDMPVSNHKTTPCNKPGNYIYAVQFTPSAVTWRCFTVRAAYEKRLTL